MVLNEVSVAFYPKKEGSLRFKADESSAQQEGFRFTEILDCNVNATVVFPIAM